MVVQREITIVAGQLGNPQTMVAPERAMKIPAQMNSSRREILKTLQNRKKWLKAKGIIKLMGWYAWLSPNESPTPAAMIITSRNDKRKPGANLGIEFEGFNVRQFSIQSNCTSAETKMEIIKKTKAPRRRDGGSRRWKVPVGLR
jgi:hypothetical protein